MRSYDVVLLPGDGIGPEVIAAAVQILEAAAPALVLAPDQFDVVCENFIGDILGDLGGATVGGLGFGPSANVGEGQAYFESVHGLAPALAGRDMANPIATVFSGGVMLERLGELNAARMIRAAVELALREGAVSVRPDGSLAEGTRAAAAAIAVRIGSS